MSSFPSGLAVGAALAGLAAYAAVIVHARLYGRRLARMVLAQITPQPAADGHVRCVRHRWVSLRCSASGRVYDANACTVCRSMEGSDMLAPQDAIQAALEAEEEAERQTSFVESDMAELARHFQASISAGRITLEEIKTAYDAGRTLRTRYLVQRASGIDRDESKTSH